MTKLLAIGYKGIRSVVGWSDHGHMTWLNIVAIIHELISSYSRLLSTLNKEKSTKKTKSLDKTNLIFNSNGNVLVTDRKSKKQTKSQMTCNSESHLELTLHASWLPWDLTNVNFITAKFIIKLYSMLNQKMSLVIFQPEG